MAAGSAIPPIRTTSSYPAQAPIAPDSGMIYYAYFSSDNVKRLSAADFALASKEKIAMVWDNCMIVLFYGENAESKALMRIFGLAASQAPGIVFASANLMAEKEIAKAFIEIGTTSHPFHWARMKGYPFILVYRGGYPAAFYNSDRSVPAIVDWAMTTACSSSYYEREQLAAGVQAEATYQMPPFDPYGIDSRNNPLRTSSIQFRTDAPIRGYDPNLPVTYVGSPEAAAETAQLRAAEAARQQRGGVLFPSSVPGPGGTSAPLPRPDGAAATPETAPPLPTVVRPGAGPGPAVPQPGPRTTPRTTPGPR